jgi:hypothetical protein
MDKEWIPVIATLFGVILGGLIGALIKRVEMNYQIRYEQRKLILGKIEQLHNEASTLLHTYIKFLNVLIQMKTLHGFEVERYNEQLELLTKSKISTSSLVYIYAPSLKDSWEEVLDQAKIFDKYTQSYFEDENITTDQLYDNFRKFSIMSNVFLGDIEKISLQYTNLRENAAAKLTS